MDAVAPQPEEPEIQTDSEPVRDPTAGPKPNSREEKDQQSSSVDGDKMELTLKRLKDLLSDEEYKCAEAVVNDYKTANLPRENVKNILTMLEGYAKRLGEKKSDQDKSGAVRIFCIVAGETFGADQTLLNHVRDQEGLSVVQCPQWQDCQVIVVFCVILSRIGSDVHAAMREVPDGKPVILVLMHHTRDVDYSTVGGKWSDSFANVELDVDVLYHQTRQGLLKCPKNRLAVSQIQEVLQRYTTKQEVLQRCTTKQVPTKSWWQSKWQ